MSAGMKAGRIAVPHGDGEVGLFYREWGKAGAERTAVCVHGISRNGSDFLWLAEDLAAQGWRVLSFDMVGRGGSDWLDDSSGYTIPVYAGHMAHVLQDMQLRDIDWIGTSMGGLLGLVMAGTGSTFRSLVLNDIGPFLSASVMAGIVEHVAVQPAFGSVKQAAAYMKNRFAPYGPVTDEQWIELAAGNLRRREGEDFRLHYDPEIIAPMRAIEPADMDLWKLWDAISCPTLVLRGGISEVLDSATAQQMTERGPEAELVTEEGITHPLWLTDEGQISTVRDFLSRT